MQRRLDGERYLASLERDGRRLAAASERDMRAQVPGCPGWRVADLVWHMGSVHSFWAAIARDELQDPSGVRRPDRPAAEELLDWYLSNLSATVDALRAADPAASVWSWSSEKNVAWILRRMAHETAVHRWDAESATGRPQAIDPSLAVDGIDEFLEFFITTEGDAPELSVHLHATDTEGEWLATIRDGRLVVDHHHRKGDVAVRGEASALLLLLWGRVPEAEVDVHGDRAVLFRFLEMAELD